MVNVVEANFEGVNGVIIVEGENREELTTPGVKELVITEARKHVNQPGLSDVPTPYPVDSEGNVPNGISMDLVAAYRCDYPIVGYP